MDNELIKDLLKIVFVILTVLNVCIIKTWIDNKFWDLKNDPKQRPVNSVLESLAYISIIINLMIPLLTR